MLHIKHFFCLAGPCTLSIKNRNSRRHALLRCRRILIVLSGFLLLPGACFSLAAPRAAPEGVEIRVTAEPKTATVGDRIRIDLDIIMPQGCRVEIPEPEGRFGDFIILDFFQGPVPVDSGKSDHPAQMTGQPAEVFQRHRARIIAALYKTGSFTFPKIPVCVTDNEGGKIEIQSPSIEIEIRSVLTEDEPALRDLKEQADIPEPSRLWLWVLLLIAVCALGTAAFYLRRKHRARTLPVPAMPARNPLDRAESELQDLMARKLPENGQTKKFYVLLSEIVKRIVGSAYAIHTAEQTTPEIMDSLHRHCSPDRGNLQAIESLLIQCDAVKFARYIPSKRENESAAENAFRILKEARASTGNAARYIADISQD